LKDNNELGACSKKKNGMVNERKPCKPKMKLSKYRGGKNLIFLAQRRSYFFVLPSNESI